MHFRFSVIVLFILAFSFLGTRLFRVIAVHQSLACKNFSWKILTQMKYNDSSNQFQFCFAVDVDHRRGGNTPLFFLVGFIIIIY